MGVTSIHLIWATKWMDGYQTNILWYYLVPHTVHDNYCTTLDWCLLYCDIWIHQAACYFNKTKTLFVTFSRCVKEWRKHSITKKTYFPLEWQSMSISAITISCSFPPPIVATTIMSLEKYGWRVAQVVHGIVSTLPDPPSHHSVAL